MEVKRETAHSTSDTSSTSITALDSNLDEHLALPSSPPTTEYDITVDSSSQSSRSRGRLPTQHEQLLSPEHVQRLPPRTPASTTRSRYRDNSSEYYTAVWGSPYERSPSPTPSARTALSEQARSEDQHLLSSPLASFGLEHLIPGRFANHPRAQTSQPASFTPILGLGIIEDEDDSHTPRSRTKRWVQLPRSQTIEKPDWWRDESQSNTSSEKETQDHEHGTAPASSAGVDFARPRSKGHNTREDNRTLNQQTFLDIVRGGKEDEMASLYASRWAATPPPEIAKELEAKAEDVQEQPREDMTTPPVDERETEAKQLENMKSEAAKEDSEQLVGDDAKAEEISESMSENVKPAEQRQRSPQEEEVEAANTPEPTAQSTRLEPPKLIRKRVSWRGKNLIVCVPNSDFATLDLPVPMSDAETQARLKRFEDDGYDTAGFRLSNDLSDSGLLAHARAIYPDEGEMRSQATQQKPKVSLPDLNKLKEDMDKLIEQKLAALGVGLVGDEPPLPPPTQAPIMQDMSRQSSGQYPPLPFSPPLPTGSAGSMGRPPMMRGHSHTMSVASPISPGVGPFGHMHRHSTFSGPMGFPQLQTQQLPQLSPVPGMQAFSPQNQFAIPGFPRNASPAQVAALRQDLGALRGPGSPLAQQMFAAQSPQDYSRGLMQDQRQRQHVYSQSVQHPASFKPFVPQMPAVQQTPVLPELPEEDDEEELLEPAPQPKSVVPEPEPPAYVPPHKRAQINADVAIPTPTRGHRHNISEGLERELLEAENCHNEERKNWIEVTTTEDDSNQSLDERRQPAQLKTVAEKDPLGNDVDVEEGTRTHRKRPSRFNVSAPSFHFNPTASFQPTAPAFTFGASAAPEPAAPKQGHNRQTSSGTFNVAAPVFKPTQTIAVPEQAEFSFSAQGPSFKPDAPAFEPPSKKESSPLPNRTVIDDLPSIFGKVNIPSIVKPAKKSKAVAIVRPEVASDSGEDVEDEDGRIMQSEDRLKRQRFGGGDGDEVPRFAEPTPVPVPEVAKIEQQPESEDVEDAMRPTEPLEPVLEAIEPADVEPADQATEAVDEPEPAPKTIPAHGHKPSSSLSALAKPFEFGASLSGPFNQNHGHDLSISELEEGEILEDDVPEVSPMRMVEPPRLEPSDGFGSFTYPSSGRIGDVAHAEPSFDEIDAVMRQLNEAGPSDEAEEPTERAMSPLPDLEETSMPGVSYIPGWPRSDAPSPSPRRKSLQQQIHADSSFTIHDRTDSGELAIEGWPHVHRLNRAEDVPTSDWSGVLSPPDEEKLQHRSAFFDSHIDDVIGRVVEQRLLPLEETMRQLQHVVVKRASSADRPSLKRTSSTVESDADDEDELSGDNKQRPVSRGRDKRIDQIKAAVLEVMREQSPKRSQSSYDLADIHTILADMKVSFARAASASLELEDVRAVVEDVLHRQSQALVPMVTEDSTRMHKRELSELEGRLNETLAGALEEANHRRDVEERASETQRMLRLAEEELTLLRDSSRDDDGRLGALHEERRELVDRLERAEAAQKQSEDRAQEVEEENEALQATLEEYRTSSNKWRQDIDDGVQQREELEGTIAVLQRQVEEAQDSSTSMRRRLEKLHGDMATAAGQLASEKAAWRAREEDYRSRCESLEAAQAAQARERHELNEELRVLYIGQAEAADTKRALEQSKTSGVSLQELIQKLQQDLAAQQSVAAHHERNFHDAKEAGRVEVQRTRVSLETDVETANHQVNIVRAELEGENAKIRTELDNVRLEAETAKARHERVLEEEETARREAVRKINHSSSIALDEARQKHERTLEDMHMQHHRQLQHAVEDKDRSEYILNERLGLADAKLQHAHDRILHLEERLEVTKSAAQAAAMSAQTRGASPKSRGLPEKISPQALRESILVLQEQLQERETTIEQMQNQLNNEGPAVLKERDSEITWLRELLAVRSEDLTDLVNTLSKPTFDRDNVRDIAIRIRANLQMEQQEKERFGYSQGSLGGQALASLSSFATPKAVSLTSAFQKWRSNMESSALKTASSRPGLRPRSMTPSKPRPSSSMPPNYMAGLMTPPASNLRSTPSPEATKSLPAPRLQSRKPLQQAVDEPVDDEPSLENMVPTYSDGPATPLFREQSYDRDAEDNEIRMQNFEDDDLDVDDAQPPAFRALEAELDTSAGAESPA